ncbi:MAG: tRNA pseudouridine(55) synthase TruB [Deltaproteobacteria bacterium]|nr:tRNA pseudouridine(55) synthase TruB [Deltaproteobacteria bacterium]
MRPGFRIVHKPVGDTSFSLVRAAMDQAAALGLAKQLKVVHGGALDPFAEGLVLLALGEATKLVDLVHEAPKSYRATIAWGVETDTGDPLGEPVAHGDASKLTRDALEAALAKFLGWHEQVPPATSNKRVDGERAYEKAHRGEAVELPASRVYLHAARFLDANTLELTCRGGFYVRSLARDLGRALGVPAHLSALVRTAIGPWTKAGDLVGDALVPWLPSRVLDDDEAIAVEQGKPTAMGSLASPSWSLPDYPMPESPIRALYRGKLVALLEKRDEKLARVTELRGGL